jgi:hypothetical protein
MNDNDSDTTRAQRTEKRATGYDTHTHCPTGRPTTQEPQVRPTTTRTAQRRRIPPNNHMYRRSTTTQGVPTVTYGSRRGQINTGTDDTTQPALTTRTTSERGPALRCGGGQTQREGKNHQGTPMMTTQWRVWECSRRGESSGHWVGGLTTIEQSQTALLFPFLLITLYTKHIPEEGPLLGKQ